MDRAAFGGEDGFVVHLGQGGVGVDGRVDFVGGEFGAHGQGVLGDEFGRVRADDVGADDFAEFFAQEHFDEALGIARRDGFAAGLVGELADLEFEVLFLRRFFG